MSRPERPVQYTLYKVEHTDSVAKCIAECAVIALLDLHVPCRMTSSFTLQKLYIVQVGKFTMMQVSLLVISYVGSIELGIGRFLSVLYMFLMEGTEKSEKILFRFNRDLRPRSQDQESPSLDIELSLPSCILTFHQSPTDSRTDDIHVWFYTAIEAAGH